MLGDQIDCRDVEAPRLDPPDGLDRDPMVALAGGQEKDELVGRQAVVECGHQRDGGLAEARRGVGEEVLALGQTPARIDEEIRLAVPHPVEGPRHAGGRRTEGRQRFATLHEDLETTSPSGTEDMKDFPWERAETTPLAIGGRYLRRSAYAAGRGSSLHGPPLPRLRVQVSRQRLPALQYYLAIAPGRLPPLREGLQRLDRDLRRLRHIDGPVHEGPGARESI